MKKKNNKSALLKSLVTRKKETALNIKATPEQIQVIKLNAKKFAGGNMSAWIRYACMNYKPSRAELI